MMRDIVIGAITNYNWDQIKCWVNSLDRSGFSGSKIMICYNISYEVAEELTKRNYSVFAFSKNDEAKQLQYSKQNFNICLDRFMHISYFLNKLSNKEDYRYVISTDVRDVIFQSNPSEWLEKNIGNKELNVACESIRYKDEDWGRQNLNLSFGPLIYDQMKDSLIYNAGTISGKFQTFLDFCQNIFISCGGAPAHVPGGGGPDQAALNVLLNMKPYKDITNFAMSEDGYAAQLGTTMFPQKIEKYRPFLVEPTPIIKDDLVCTSTGKPFAIVHQYDRVPELVELFEKKYAG
jgi:hypothetical protein